MILFFIGKAITWFLLIIPTPDFRSPLAIIMEMLVKTEHETYKNGNVSLEI